MMVRLRIGARCYGRGNAYALDSQDEHGAVLAFRGRACGSIVDSR